jgi:hypothetical protein
MNARHPKVLKAKPPRRICSLPEAFSFVGDHRGTQDSKRNLPPVFRSDVTGCSRLAGKDEAELASGVPRNGHPSGH